MPLSLSLASLFLILSLSIPRSFSRLLARSNVTPYDFESVVRPFPHTRHFRGKLEHIAARPDLGEGAGTINFELGPMLECPKTPCIEHLIKGRCNVAAYKVEEFY